MKSKFQHAITATDVAQIIRNEFTLPEAVCDVLPKTKETLLKTLTPAVSADVYSIIREKSLLLDLNLFEFFGPLLIDEIIFMEVYSKFDSENGNNSSILFSRIADFSDLQIETNPIVSNRILSLIKELEPLPQR